MQPPRLKFSLSTSQLLCLSSTGFQTKKPHFCNKVTKSLSHSLGVKHHIWPCIRLGQTGVWSLSSMKFFTLCTPSILETRTLEANWTSLVSAIQRIINNCPSRRIWRRSPITVHTGMPSEIPLTVALNASHVRNVRSVNQAWPKQKMKIEIAL